MSIRHHLWVALLVSTAVSSASHQTTEAGRHAVQLVYESDTRGYYLPCG